MSDRVTHGLLLLILAEVSGDVMWLAVAALTFTTVIWRAVTRPDADEGDGR